MLLYSFHPFNGFQYLVYTTVYHQIPGAIPTKPSSALTQSSNGFLVVSTTDVPPKIHPIPAVNPIKPSPRIHSGSVLFIVSFDGFFLLTVYNYLTESMTYLFGCWIDALLLTILQLIS